MNIMYCIYLSREKNLESSLCDHGQFHVYYKGHLKCHVKNEFLKVIGPKGYTLHGK